MQISHSTNNNSALLVKDLFDCSTASFSLIINHMLFSDQIKNIVGLKKYLYYSHAAGFGLLKYIRHTQICLGDTGAASVAAYSISQCTRSEQRAPSVKV